MSRRSCPAAFVLYLATALLPSRLAAETEYILSLEYETSAQRFDGQGSGHSSGHQALAERIIGTTADGIEVEYFIPFDPDEIKGNEKWMFPARMLIAPDGTKTILNEPQMMARLDSWLVEANWSREVCSQWLFTWTAIQIRCDPKAAIEAVETYGMRPGRIAEGERFAPIGAATPAVLAKTGMRNGRIVLTATVSIDPAFVRKGAADSAMVVAQISGEELSPEVAAIEVAAIDATGTVSVEFEVDDSGMVWKRTDTSEVTVTGDRHGDETRHSVQIVTRTPLAEWGQSQSP